MINEVTVYNSQGHCIYLTETKDVSFNYVMGNEPMINFTTIDGRIICLPNTVIIEQKQIEDPRPKP